MNRRLLNYCIIVLISLAVSAFGLNTNHARILSLVLGVPGVMLGVLLSPQGEHGGREIYVVAFIANTILYFLLLRFLVARRLFKAT